jgi:hypothetical protein
MERRRIADQPSDQEAAFLQGWLRASNSIPVNSRPSSPRGNTRTIKEVLRGAYLLGAGA